MREIPSLLAFNRGLVSPLGLARIDQKRIGLSAETMTNWIPRVLGSMSLRPGLGYIGSTASNAAARVIPFVFATTDSALCEFTDSAMRIWIQDTLLTRVSVSSAVTNGTFSGNITGWTDGSDSGGAIAFESGNFLKLTGNGKARAIAYQAVSVSAADQSKEHGLRIVIARGPVTLRIGTALGYDDIVAETALDTGEHSIAFTPSVPTFYIQFSTTAAYKVLVQSVAVESAGVVSITSPYQDTDLSNIRFDQSGDIIFLACGGFQQRKIERRGTHPNARSWSLCLYHVDDGPFRTENLGPTSVTASATTGDITLTASAPLFRTKHVGALWAVTSVASGATNAISAQNTFTDSVKVIGVGASREINITLTGTWVATVTLQSSTDNSSFTDVAGESWGGNVSATYSDGLDNQIIYYRVGIKSSNYTSGTVVATINFASGTQTGVALITALTSNTVVTARVLKDMGSTAASTFWAEGQWSDYRGWPTSVRFHEGRLWWAGQNGVFGSISDSFFSFDEDVLGDSGPINRTIGSGPVDTINWIISLQRMILGAQGAEFSVKSSALDTPLTPTDFSIKPASTQGSSAVDPARIDQRAVFVDRSGIKVFEIVFDLQSYEYSSNDLTSVVPELGSPGIVRLAVQRKPDTRIHCVRSDGTVMLGVLDKVEDVLCWLNVTSDGASGLIEDVAVLPAQNGSTEDQVYYVVNRTVNGSSVRFLEKWASETECRGGSLNKQADAFITYSGAPITTVTGLSHLEGQSVIAWGDGVDLSPGVEDDQVTYTVSGGQITLDSPVENVVVGLPYRAQWKSAKTGIQVSATATTLNQQRRISHLGLVAAYLHPKGLRIGPDFDDLDDLPSVEHGTEVDADEIRTAYDEQEMPFPGVWDSDARLCMQAQAPRPVTVLAASLDLEFHR